MGRARWTARGPFEARGMSEIGAFAVRAIDFGSGL
jgi:hypothetical protein